MSNIGVNTFVKLDFTFYKKKLIGKVMKTNILGYLNGNSSYIYVVIYVHECNFNTYTYFTPFVQGYNLRGDRNNICIFLPARGLIYLLKLIFFFSNRKFFSVNSAIKSRPDVSTQYNLFFLK